MFAKALAAAPAGCTAALGTVVDPRLPIVFGGRGVRSGGVTGVGSGTAGLDYPRPPAVSKPKCNNAVGGKADAAAAAARGGGEKEAALTRVKSLFAALKVTVGNGQGGATVVTTASGVQGHIKHVYIFSGSFISQKRRWHLYFYGIKCKNHG